MYRSQGSKRLSLKPPLRPLLLLDSFSPSGRNGNLFAPLRPSNCPSGWSIRTWGVPSALLLWSESKTMAGKTSRTWCWRFTRNQLVLIISSDTIKDLNKISNIFSNLQRAEKKLRMPDLKLASNWKSCGYHYDMRRWSHGNARVIFTMTHITTIPDIFILFTLGNLRSRNCKLESV